MARPTSRGVSPSCRPTGTASTRTSLRTASGSKMSLAVWVTPDFDGDKHHIALLDASQLAVVTRGSDEHLDLAEARTGRVRTEYVAKGKEKLADVAKKFGMGSHDLARINRVSYDTRLQKDQQITLDQVADPKT